MNIFSFILTFGSYYISSASVQNLHLWHGVFSLRHDKKKKNQLFKFCAWVLFLYISVIELHTYIYVCNWGSLTGCMSKDLAFRIVKCLMLYMSMNATLKVMEMIRQFLTHKLTKKMYATPPRLIILVGCQNSYF